MSEQSTQPTELAADMRRTFLVAIEESDHLRAALHFACRRAVHTSGTVALFYAVPPSEFHHFSTVAELMDHEAKTEAERLLQQVASDVHRRTGTFPELYLRQGDTLPELQKVIKENTNISMLVLAADPGPSGPGALIAAISGKLAGKIDIPVTIVPGDLSEDRIDALT